MSGRNPYAGQVRVLRLLRYLQSRAHGASWYDLAALFDVSRRTIRRDVQAIRAAGFDVVVDPSVGPSGESERALVRVRL